MSWSRFRHRLNDRLSPFPIHRMTRMAMASSPLLNSGTSWPTLARSWLTRRWMRWSGRLTSMVMAKWTTKVNREQNTKKYCSSVLCLPSFFRVRDDDDLKIRESGWDFLYVSVFFLRHSSVGCSYKFLVTWRTIMRLGSPL